MRFPAYHYRVQGDATAPLISFNTSIWKFTFHESDIKEVGEETVTEESHLANWIACGSTEDGATVLHGDRGPPGERGLQGLPGPVALEVEVLLASVVLEVQKAPLERLVRWKSDVKSEREESVGQRGPTGSKGDRIALEVIVSEHVLLLLDGCVGIVSHTIAMFVVDSCLMRDVT